MRIVIADDEALGRERLRIFIDALNADTAGASAASAGGATQDGALQILAECDGGRATVEAVRERQPDLLFLDIQMPDLDGFGVIDALSRQVPLRMPHVVFVTAHNEHAVRAFEMHALDFVLKPVSRERFAATVQRARAALAACRKEGLSGALQAQLAAWLAQERPPAAGTVPAAGQRWRERIEVKNPQRWDYVPVTEILWMRAGGNYIELVASGKTHLIRETMHDMEAQLDPALFLRIGRSVMVNLAAVRAIRPAAKGAPVVELSDGTALPVQRNFDELQQRLQFVRVRA